VAERIKEIPNEHRVPYLKDQLVTIRKKFPHPFSFALDARMEAQDFKPEKCKVLDSKKLPLWLVLTPSEEEEDIFADGSNADAS